jgi:hypothetical protein
MKKLAISFGLVFGGVGALLTLVVLATLEWKLGFRLGFEGSRAVLSPAMALARLLGISQSTDDLLWSFLAVVTNTALCFSVGALLGLFAHLIARPTPKNNGTSG